MRIANDYRPAARKQVKLFIKDPNKTGIELKGYDKSLKLGASPI